MKNMYTKEGLGEQFKFPFSDQATDTLNYAEEGARRFKHRYIGTEHILLGLSRQELPTLELLGVENGKVQMGIEYIIGIGDREVTGDIGLTPRAKKIVEYSIEEANRRQSHEIVNDDLLLGVVREGEGIAVGVLESLGVSLENVRRAVGRDAVTNRALLSLGRLGLFLQDPEQDAIKKQQLQMILDGAVGLIFPPNQR